MKQFKDWSRMAEWYVGQRPTSYAISQTKNTIEEMLGNVKDKIVLDVGTGSGYFAGLAASKGANVTAVDVSSKMVRLAKNQPYTKGVEFSIQNVYDLAFKNKSFDVIMADMLLNNTNDLESVLGGFNDILKDDGHVVVTLLHECDTKKKLVCPDKSNEISEVSGEWTNKDTGEKYKYELFHIPKNILKQSISESGFKINRESIPLPPRSLKNENPVLYEERMKRPTFYLLDLNKK